MRTFKLRLKEALQLSAGTHVTGFTGTKVQILKQKLLSAGDAMQVRRGMLLEVCTMSGHVGVGECTPLPGFHTETFEQAHAQLLLVAELLHGRILPPYSALLTYGKVAAWVGARPTGLESFTSWHLASPSSPHPPAGPDFATDTQYLFYC